MSTPFDTSMKDLLTRHGSDWLNFFGLAPAGQLEPVNTSLATVNVQADKVFQVRADPPWIWHLDTQAGWDKSLLRRALKYNVLLSERFDPQPVLSTLVLLKRKANLPALTGELELLRPDGQVGIAFRYDVVRIWQVPVDRILEGGVGILPMAPVCDVAEDEVPKVMQTIHDRFLEETEESEAKQLWATTYLLLGLRFSEAVADQLIARVIRMEESTTYQAIHRRGREVGQEEGIPLGRVQEARAILVRLATKKHGEPSGSIREAVSDIADLERLERMLDGYLEARSWQDVLDIR